MTHQTIEEHRARIARDTVQYIKEKTRRRVELIEFILWWEKNIGDGANGKFFYWDDDNRKLYKPDQIIEHYLSRTP